jgi:hypothetical protein
MGILLAAGAIGAVIRHQAPNPSTLRDVGTLLMVLWLPAVGNVIAFLIRKIPRRAPPRMDFAPGSPFVAHLRAVLEPLPVPDTFATSLDPAADRATLVAARQGFTVRTQQPIAQWLRDPSAAPVAMECLSPDIAVRFLAPGTVVHVLVGPTAVAKGRIA